MTEDREERIRQRAYAIWEREGRRDGDHERHWLQAADEIDTEAGERIPPAHTATGAGPALAEHTKDAPRQRARSTHHDSRA